jgi:hypothetical protein
MIHYPLQTHFKLTIMLQVCQTEQEPTTIGTHLMVRQEECMDMGFIWPLVIMVLFVFHLLNLSLQKLAHP